jgi:hypothetical protein
VLSINDSVEIMLRHLILIALVELHIEFIRMAHLLMKFNLLMRNRTLQNLIRENAKNSSDNEDDIEDDPLGMLTSRSKQLKRAQN